MDYYYHYQNDQLSEIINIDSSYINYPTWFFWWYIPIKMEENINITYQHDISYCVSSMSTWCFPLLPEGGRVPNSVQMRGCLWGAENGKSGGRSPGRAWDKRIVRLTEQIWTIYSNSINEYYIISDYIILYYTILYYIIQYHIIILLYITWYYTMLYYIILLYYVTWYYTMLYYIILL